MYERKVDEAYLGSLWQTNMKETCEYCVEWSCGIAVVRVTVIYNTPSSTERDKIHLTSLHLSLIRILCSAHSTISVDDLGLTRLQNSDQHVYTSTYVTVVCVTNSLTSHELSIKYWHIWHHCIWGQLIVATVGTCTSVFVFQTSHNLTSCLKSLKYTANVLHVSPSDLVKEEDYTNKL